jgi:hypothetical protein
MEPIRRIRDSSRLRALLPFLFSVMACLVVVAWLYHRKRAQSACITFNVQLNRQIIAYDATLNGSPYESGAPCGVGSKTLRIQVENAEPFETNIFIWYSGAAIGTIALPHSKGILSLDVAPSPNTISIHGELFEKEVSNCSREKLEIPVGSYEIVAKFARFSIARTVKVSRNAATSEIIRPTLAALKLTTEPPVSQFHLESIGIVRVTEDGNTPTTLSSLPTGKYQLTVWQNNYRKVIPIALDLEGTNELKVKFEYAHITFNSHPEEAVIREGQSAVGATPSTLAFSPGKHRVSLEKPGYYTTNIEFQVSATEQREFTVNLQNAAFREAMDRARSLITSGLYQNYDQASRQVDQALIFQPNDSDALKLKNLIYVKQQVVSASNSGRAGHYDEGLKAIDLALEISSSDEEVLALQRNLKQAKVDAEDHRRRLEIDRKKMRLSTLFEERLAKMWESNLFETQKLDLKGDAQKIREGILRAMNEKPAFTLDENKGLEAGFFLINASVKSGGSKQRVLFIVGQTTDDNVEVYFKFWDYVLGNKVTLTLDGISNDSWVPLTPARTSGDHRLESRRLDNLRILRSRIEAQVK